MIKHAKLKITALQGLHTGSDNQNTGNFKMQARKPHLVTRDKINSNFIDDAARRRAAVEVATSLWESIPSEVRLDRAKTINEEFFSALSFASFGQNKAAFLQIFGAKFGCRGMIFSDEAAIAIDAFSDIEFLETMRNETQIIQIMLKSRRNDKKNKTKGSSLFDVESDIKPENEAENVPSGLLEQGLEYIPVLSANQFRHTLRDLAMSFFFEFIEKKTFTQSGYYQYFSGGALTASSGKIVMEKLLQTINLCPPLALFGTAKGDRMIEGALMVSDIVPRCKELGTAQISHYQIINAVFGTRKDGAKDERRYQIHEETSANPQQMLYYTESIVPGTELDAILRVQQLSDNENHKIVLSCLAHTLELAANSQKVGAKSAVAHGQARIEIIENTLGVDSSLYLNFLNENKREIEEVMKYE